MDLVDEVAVLMRQTQYTREEAEHALQANTLEACIKQYLEVKEKPVEIVSVNQGIFKSIRDFIDNVSIDKSSDNASS
jgi:DNA polymerase/3'-5' exonuclease PolX